MGVSVYVDARPQLGAPFEQFDSAATDRDGMFILDGLPRRPLQINLNHHGFRIQTEALPPERDQVEWTYRLEPDPRDRSQPALAHDEPIPPGLRERLTFVDLDRKGNDFLADGPGGYGNDLNRLPRGIHKLGDVYFRIGEKMVHVQGRERPDLPRSVKGIPVQARADQLHFLHATQGGADSEDTLIGAYVIHYADGSSERIPLVYGREHHQLVAPGPGPEVDRSQGRLDRVERHGRRQPARLVHPLVHHHLDQPAAGEGDPRARRPLGRQGLRPVPRGGDAVAPVYIT